ncbi:MAG TPA: hypothetical protein V6D43_20465 [Candidatus Sericytochromatia bacterium]
MCLSNTHEPHLELAIDVLKSQNPALVISLKDFLTVLPNPKCVEEVLIGAIYQLAEVAPDACRWILRNSYYLEPELDLVELTMSLALKRLQDEGFELGKDFKVESHSRLHMAAEAKTRLMIEDSIGDRLLLEELLHVCD